MSRVHNKENILRTPTKKKSYSILASPQLSSPPKLPTTKERIISQSTGLVKFSLSPPRKPIPRKTEKRQGLPFYLPTSVNEEIKLSDVDAKQKLLQEYAAKQLELADLESKVKTVKFRMLEISINLKQFDEEELQKLPINLESLRQKANDFASNNIEVPLESLKKKASTMFTPHPELELQYNTLKKKASDIFQSPQKTASPNFKNLFQEVKNRFEPKPKYDNREDLANSSFTFENLKKSNRAIVEESDQSAEYDDSEILDIDDYTSSFDTNT